MDNKYDKLKHNFKKWMLNHSTSDISREYTKAGGHKKISEEATMQTGCNRTAQEFTRPHFGPPSPARWGDRPLQPSQTNPTVSHVAQSASREIWPKSWIRGCWNQKIRMRFWRRHTRMQPLLCTKTCGKKRHTMRRARILTTRRRARDKSDCSTGPFGSWDLEHPPM